MMNFGEFLGIIFIACPLMVWGTIILTWGVAQMFHYTKYDSK